MTTVNIQQSPKIHAEQVFQHYKELDTMNFKGKHTMYNSLIKLLRKKKIQLQTINNNTIVCSGLLNGLWFRPDGLRCRVFLSTWHPRYRKGVESFNFVVDYDFQTLFKKLLKHGIISAGTHEYLTTSNKD